jgi:3-oxoacyl-[acyl-carrier protein] reductase
MGIQLANKVVLITGGSGDIGKAIGTAFLNEGAKVTLAARTEEKLLKAAREMQSNDFKPQIICGDISNESNVNRIFKETVKHWGCIDILVNAAGFCVLGPVEEATLEDWDRTMDVNAKGIFLCCREAVRQMLTQQGKGQIINIVSYQGIDSRPNVGIYGASKHAVMGLTRSLIQEVQPSGIRVSALCPMPVRTKMRQDLFPEKDLSTYLDPSEIAEAAVYIATRSFLGGIRELIVGLDRKLGGL